MGLRAHKDNRIRKLLSAGYCRSDGPAAFVIVGVMMIARDEDDQGVRITPQYMKHSHCDRNAGAAV
jgi:hypothetical protein